MSCAEVLAKLETYCDGELSRWDRRRLERHLAACPPCVDRREFRTTLQQVVRDKCARSETPPDLLERIRRSLSSGP
ncbi:MAG TPA: mycothiol system anti-sigma-R factor [Actinomycetota bacterium]|nr:mycothiol system anti-sigma-R factor [Actinomycetota bacterium]